MSVLSFGQGLANMTVNLEVDCQKKKMWPASVESVSKHEVPERCLVICTVVVSHFLSEKGGKHDGPHFKSSFN